MQIATNSPNDDSSMGCHSQCLPLTLKVVGAAFSPTLRVLQPLSLGAPLRWARTAFQRLRRRRRPTDGRHGGKCTPLGMQEALSLSEFRKWRCGGHSSVFTSLFYGEKVAATVVVAVVTSHLLHTVPRGAERERHEWRNGPLVNINALHESGASLRP